MKFYVAPLEGITGYVYRNAHQRVFGQVDKYFTPFLSATNQGTLRSRELTDVLPEHNGPGYIVPQILTNKAEDFLSLAKILREIGYEEVNLNLGCPSGTVVSKNKGSGFLAYPQLLDEFLQQIFQACPCKLSIKTRLGKENPEEFERLLEIFNQYPLEELIIHPRVQKDFYKHKVRKKAFLEALPKSKNPVYYNGDLFTTEDYRNIVTECPTMDGVMLGRGLIGNPGLIQELKGEKRLEKNSLREFHDLLLEGYEEMLSGDRNVLFRMKELWFYMHHMFTNPEKYAKKICKSQTLEQYRQVVAQLFLEQEIVECGGFSTSK